jgi:hypothetical protein
MEEENLVDDDPRSPSAVMASIFVLLEATGGKELWMEKMEERPAD